MKINKENKFNFTDGTCNETSVDNGLWLYERGMLGVYSPCNDVVVRSA